MTRAINGDDQPLATEPAFPAPAAGAETVPDCPALLPAAFTSPGTVVVPDRPAFPAGAACLVHIYPTGPGMGTRYPLGDQPLTVGRSGSCDLCIPDDTVSRRHALIEPQGGALYVVDLNSTNGTYVNNVRAVRQLLRDGDYLHVGNCIYRFLSGSNVENSYHEEIYRLTIIDALTDTYNKRYLLEALDREVARVNRHGRPLTLLLFDIDHFKRVNDERGHLCGDFSLRELASRVKAVIIRKGDLLARYGGEEFAVVLPETDHEGGLQVAERIRVLVAQQPFRFANEPYPVTVSVGVATTTLETPGTSLEMISLADEKLYEAKRLGRNRVAG
jgi:two-component system, cell cycle response regulator